MVDDSARQQAENEKALGEAHGQTELVRAAEKRAAALKAADVAPPAEAEAPRSRQSKRA